MTLEYDSEFRIEFTYEFIISHMAINVKIMLCYRGDDWQ